MVLTNEEIYDPFPKLTPFTCEYAHCPQLLLCGVLWSASKML